LTVKWYGAEFLKDLREATPDSLFEAAEKFVEVAKARAPIDEGDLRESGFAATKDKSTWKKKKTNRKQPKVKEGEAIAGFADFKAGWLEFGTKKMRAQPFMRPTLDEAKEQLGGVVAAGLKRRMKK
jgi:HK97 gp10 family phage protein